MATALQSPLLTRDEAAAYLGVKTQTLALWASTGRYALPFVKVGRLSKYRQSDLDDFLTQNTATQTS
jgi:excisionase family DNA binding protein